MQKGKLIGQGRTAEVFEWGENRLLKLYRSGFPKAAIENEFRVSLALFNKNLPVPEVDRFVELDDRLGIVYERVNGRTMMSLLSSKPWKVVGEAQKLAELHKAIQIDIDAKIPSQKLRLKESIAKSEILSDKLKVDLFGVLQRLPDGNVLCHGDFHPENVMVSKNKVVVIDWMTATMGNPLSDVARTSIILKFGVVPEHKSKIETNIINFGRVKFFTEYIKHYLKITGVSRESIERWEVVLAAGRLIEWLPPKEKEKLLGFVVAQTLS